MEVKLLESDVLNSPRVISFQDANDTVAEDMTRQDTTGTGQLCTTDLDITELDIPIPAPESHQSVPAVPVWSDPAQPNSPSRYCSADPFDSPHSPTGQTTTKLCQQSSNIPDHLTYFSPLDSSNPYLLPNTSLDPGSLTLNASYLPDPCWDESKCCPSPTSPSHSQTANTTMWDMNTSPPLSGLFLSSKLECKTVYRARQVFLSKTRTASVLMSPYDITFYQPTGTDGFFLVTEPNHDRVGVFSNTTMNYLGSLGRRDVQFQYPTSILALSGGGLMLLENNKLQIFDDQCILVGQLDGC